MTSKHRLCAFLLLTLAACSSSGDFAPWWHDNTPWRMIAGANLNQSWPFHDGPNAVRSMALFNGRPIAATVNDPHHDGQVWRFDDPGWIQIGGNGLNGSWPSNSVQGAYSLAANATYLYAGTGEALGEARVWRFNGTSWQLIGGDGMNGSWPAATHDCVWSLAFHQGELYAGLITEKVGINEAVLYRYNEGTNTWTYLTGVAGELGGWSQADGYFMTYVLASDGTNLYVGLAGRTPGTADVWRYNGATFQQIGGDGLNGGWFDPNLQFVEDLIVTPSGDLLATLQGSPLHAPIWKYAAGAWQPLGDFPMEWKSDTIFNKLLELNGKIYSTAGGPPGSPSVWELQGNSTWLKVGGGGLDGSSWNHTPGQNDPSSRFWIYSMIPYQGRLWCGFAGWPETAQIWSWPN